MVGDWSESHFGVFLSVGSSEMGEEDEGLGVVFGDLIDGGEGL